MAAKFGVFVIELGAVRDGHVSVDAVEGVFEEFVLSGFAQFVDVWYDEVVEECAATFVAETAEDFAEFLVGGLPVFVVDFFQKAARADVDADIEAFASVFAKQFFLEFVGFFGVAVLSEHGNEKLEGFSVKFVAAGELGGTFFDLSAEFFLLGGAVLEQPGFDAPGLDVLWVEGACEFEQSDDHGINLAELLLDIFFGFFFAKIFFRQHQERCPLFRTH